MKKLTVEQAVAAVQESADFDGIYEALMTCTKMAMLDVYEAVTGLHAPERTVKGFKKQDEADFLTRRIISERFTAIIKVKSFDEKFEMLLAADDDSKRMKLLHVFSKNELDTTARRLGVDIAGDAWITMNRIVRELEIRNEIAELNKLREDYGNDDALFDVLYDTLCDMSDSALDKLIKQAGLPEEPELYPGSAHMQKADLLYHFYIETAKVDSPCEEPVFDEEYYSPDYQENLAVLDDVSEDRIAESPSAQTQPARFEIGRHYKEEYATSPSIYTFLGMCSNHYGYFVDSLNSYYRVKIKEDERGEYANAPHTKGSPYVNGTIYARNEVPEHEIISCANGTSVLLNAEKVIHSYEELEEALKPMKKTPVEHAVELVQRAETEEEIQAVLMSCTKAVMAEVYEAVTGQPADSLHIKSTDKKYQAEIYAVKIIRYRTDDAFKAKPFDEKFEMLLAAKTMYARIEQIGFYSKQELIWAAQELGLKLTNAWEYKTEDIEDAVLRELKIRYEISCVKQLREKRDYRQLGSQLGFNTSEETLDRLIKQAGVTVILDSLCKTTHTMKADALYFFYTQPAKELKAELHKLWLIRNAIRKAQRMINITPAEYSALGGIWEKEQPRAKSLLREYFATERRCAA